MIQDVKALPVSYYFSPDGKTSFFIPKYQREYVWGQKNWEALFNDLDESPEGHFLGSIICVNAQQDSMEGGRLELIDGQQRFTTISLLLCAFYDKLNAIPNPDRRLMVELDNLESRIFVGGTGRWRLDPSEQAQNKSDFQKVLSELFPKIVKAPPGLSNFGNRRIARAYRYFCDRLSDISPEQSVALLEKLKAAMLVKIEVRSHSDAFMLFESINNRGIPLSAIDIIKNNLLAELDKHPSYGIERAFAEWKDLIDLLPDPIIQERFLRQLYNMFRYLERVEVKGCQRATKSNLITIYDTVIRKRPVWLFQAMQVAANTYSRLLTPADAKEHWGESAGNALQDLQRLGAAAAYSFLLWGIHLSRSQNWNESVIVNELAPTLTKWFFWRNLTDTPPTRELDQVFVDLVSHLLRLIDRHEIKTEQDFISQTRLWLVGKAASDDVRASCLSGDIYQVNYEATRFILCKLEEIHQTREHKRDLWIQDPNGRPIFTVEHILPRTENLSSQWEQMLVTTNAPLANEVRDRCVHKLGNLTLSGYNSKLGTMDFERKRDRKNDRGDYIGYKNGLYLNSDLAELSVWNESTITARTNVLVAEIMTLMNLRES